MKESISRARRENVRAVMRHIVSIARLVLALVVSSVMFGLTSGLGLIAPFAWGGSIGLILGRWWALWFAVLVFITALGFDNIAGDRSASEVARWYLTAFWALIPTTVALAGIAVGVAVIVAGRRITRRVLQARSQRRGLRV